MSKAPKEENNRTIDPESWVDRYGDYLYGFALSRLVDSNTAEDVVQETFLSALRSMKNFRGHSSEKTWLTSILKHKILDHLRAKYKNMGAGRLENSPQGVEQFFDGKGHWKIGPSKWHTDPKKVFEQKEFLRILYDCLEELSRQMARVFVLREMEGLSTEDICKVLNISATNCWVILYRARTLLRRCLELNWFDATPDGAL